jgi:bacterioferritin (cytochrome b1)
MPIDIENREQVIAALNRALAWELRASALYAHYAAYVKGLEKLTLEPLFKEEARESFGHAETVRRIIAELDGEAVTDRDPAPIVHTEDTHTMLEEALKTEQAAARQYTEIAPLLRGYYPHFHDIVHIQKDELEAVVEFETLLGR